MIPDFDLNLSINYSDMTNMTAILFDKAILSQYIPLKADGELDSCRRFSAPSASPFEHNVGSDDKTAMESCNGQFVYDTSIYHTSRVYDVS